MIIYIYIYYLPCQKENKFGGEMYFHRSILSIPLYASVYVLFLPVSVSACVRV